MSLNKPSDFFERKKDEELARKKLKEEQELANKKVSAPKEFFGEEEVVEIVEEVKPKANPNLLTKIREALKFPYNIPTIIPNSCSMVRKVGVEPT